MKNLIITIFLVGLISVFLPAYSFALGKAKVTVKVIDEKNIPIDQADVEIGFRHIKLKAEGNGWGNDVDYHPAKGTTNKDGIFSASDKTSPNVVVIVTKNGFYRSAIGVPFNEAGDVEKKPLEVVLKAKRNPVPMYAKKIERVKIPAFDQPVGYDLEVGDWVSPHGKGVISDFIFNFSKKENEITYVLTFSNSLDGIQEYAHPSSDNSQYRWPFEAPLDGYTDKISKSLRYVAERRETNLKDEVEYIYRVRTRTDKEGQVNEACYGKIAGEIDVSTRGNIYFTYYFNPNEKSRSLEFNTEKNLFIPEGAESWEPKYSQFPKNDF